MDNTEDDIIARLEHSTDELHMDAAAEIRRLRAMVGSEAANVDTLERIVEESKRRAAPLEAELTTVAAEHLEQQKISGQGHNEAIRNYAHAQAQALDARERALREQLRDLRNEQAHWGSQLALVRRRVERARIVDDADRRRRRDMAAEARRV